MPSPTWTTVPTERDSMPASNWSMADLMMVVMSSERIAIAEFLLVKKVRGGWGGWGAQLAQDGRGTLPSMSVSPSRTVTPPRSDGSDGQLLVHRPLPAWRRCVREACAPRLRRGGAALVAVASPCPPAGCRAGGVGRHTANVGQPVAFASSAARRLRTAGARAWKPRGGLERPGHATSNGTDGSDSRFDQLVVGRDLGSGVELLEPALRRCARRGNLEGSLGRSAGGTCRKRRAASSAWISPSGTHRRAGARVARSWFRPRLGRRPASARSATWARTSASARSALRFDVCGRLLAQLLDLTT